MNRLPQVLLIASFVPLSWYAMLAVHELGHVLAAWSTGGTVTGVILHPLAISRTDVLPNPHPLSVVWAGPLLGVVLPLIVWGLFCAARIPGAFLPRFWAGFCLLANGGYIGLGSFAGIGDAGDMLRLGSPIWSLWLFGLVTMPVGLLLWHRQGTHFGLGKPPTSVSPRTAYISLTLLAITLAAMFALSPRI